MDNFQYSKLRMNPGKGKKLVSYKGDKAIVMGTYDTDKIIIMLVNEDLSPKKDNDGNVIKQLIISPSKVEHIGFVD